MAIRRTRVITRLTMSPAKADVYAVDPYFRDGWETLRSVLPSAARVRAFAWTHVPLLIRPDGVAAGRGRHLLDRLCQRGLEPTGYERVMFDRRLVREMWRYQLNVATRDRVRMMDRLLIGRPALLVLLRAAGGSRVVGPARRPACVELRTLKGPSRPDRRNGTHLRQTLSDATASVLTLIHTPDEPIDVIRDLAVLLDETGIRRLLADAPCVRNWRDAVLAELAALRTVVGAHSLDFETAAARLGHAVPAVNGNGAADPITELLDEVTEPGWDRLVVAAHLAPTHFSDCDPVVPDTDVSAWGCPVPRVRRRSAAAETTARRRM